MHMYKLKGAKLYAIIPVGMKIPETQLESVNNFFFSMSFELKDLKNFEQVFPTKMCTSIYSFFIALFFFFFFSDFFHVELLNKSFEYNTCYFHCTM